jgi:hypothetical protein
MKQKRPVLKTLLVVTLTAGAVFFAALNLRDRMRQPPVPDDGVVWVDSAGGILAAEVRDGSPASNAGIRQGQYLRAIYFDGAYELIKSAADVRYYLDEVGIGGSLVYAVERINARGVSQGIWEGDVKGIDAMPRNQAWDLYLALIGAVYLLIGVFVFLRQSQAPYSFHFFWICLTAFLFHALTPTYAASEGNDWSRSDLAVYLTDNIALILAAPLFLHFCAVFPRKSDWLARRRYAPALFYIPATLLILLELAMLAVPGAVADLGLWRSATSTANIVQFTVGILAGDILLLRSYLTARTAILRQQLKWIVWGVGLAAAPFAVLYTWPYLMGRPIPGLVRWLAILPLILVPLSFGYSIVRYRMMDVDVIMRRSFVHVLATVIVGALYMLLLLTVGDVVKEISPDASPWVAKAVTVAGMLLVTILFAPVKTWLQQTADRLFYGERYTFRRGLGEFGRALASSPALDPLLESLAARLRRMLSIDRLAIFVEDADAHVPDEFRLMLAQGLDCEPVLPAEFARWVRANSAVRGYAQTEELESNWAGLSFLVPCVVRDRLVAVIGVGRATTEGALLTSEDLEILRALSGYVAVAIENCLLLKSEREKVRAIALLKEFSDSIIESVNVGILVVDRGGKITTWNSALEEMLGIERGEVLGASAAEVFNEEMLETIRAVTGVSGWVVTDLRHLYKFRTVTRDGRPIVINLSLAPFEDATKSIAGTLVVVEDVTERVKLEEQLQQSDKLSSIGLLAAGVAHEVNTPLAGVSSYAQMLASQLPESDPKARLLAKILAQTQRASGIVNNLLNFSRTSNADFAPLDLNRTLDDTLQLLEIQLRKHDIVIEKQCAEDLPEAYGNASKLQQVFMNLILNARDAMPSGGTLRLETSAADHTLVVRITDTGMGIAPENITKIYDPFFTTKGVGQGTGLGLAVSYGIIQEHSGRIFVESAPGKGTTFTIKLPSLYRRMQVASD